MIVFQFQSARSITTIYPQANHDALCACSAQASQPRFRTTSRMLSGTRVPQTVRSSESARGICWYERDQGVHIPRRTAPTAL
jgi:hypothetical protein